VEGFVGDLLRTYSHEKAKGWIYKSLHASSFTGAEIGHRAFAGVIERLTELRLVEKKTGFQKWTKGFGEGAPKLPHFRYASRFKATRKLLELSERCGVPVADAKAHFIPELPSKPLQLRAKSKRNEYGAKERGKPMPFERTPLTEELQEQVRELNEFFDRFELRGGTHRGFIRVFNQGDDPDFDWNKGGRVYSQGDDNYQVMSKEDRLRMTINGEAVCEIDIRASYLTIFHAWHGEELDPSSDPYDLPGLGREARPRVKLWFVATFGNDSHLTRWPAKIVRDYREETGRKLGKDFPLSVIREAAIKAFPILARLGQRKRGWADLMYLESVAMIATMTNLMRKHGVPSLSIHDSLIVPVSKQALALRELTACYHRATKVKPKLVVQAGGC
jgi:hypothetical protein